MYSVSPIRTEADYQAALERIHAIFDAKPGSMNFDELDILATLVEAYEAKHHPIEIESGILAWLQHWYASQCDGDWEHGENVRISSIDNPGWSVDINLEGTIAENLTMEWKLIEQTKGDWYGYSIQDGKYRAAGDPSKLFVLLEKFKELVTI